MNNANLTYFLYLFSSNRTDSANSPNYMEICNALLREIKNRFPTVAKTYLHKIIYSIGKLPFNDAFFADHIRAEIDLMTKQKLQDVRLETYLVYMLYAISKELLKQCEWPALVQRFRELLSLSLPSETPKAVYQRISQVFFNCLITDLIDGPLCLQYLEMVVKHPTLKAEYTTTKNIIHLMSIDVPDKEKTLEFINKHFKPSEIETYGQSALQVLQNSRPKLAFMHYWLAYYLKRAGFAFESEFKIGYRHIDIYVPSLKLLIECDGLSHYIFENDTKKTNSITRYRNRMLQEWDAAGENSLVTIETGFQQDKNQTLDFLTEQIGKFKSSL